MNKTISINLSGMLFNLEEAAYERLHRYLQQIRKSFEGTDGQDEIVGDIESRIAELFAERLKNKQVILEQEVIDVIAIMGEPETYKDEEEAPTSGSNPGNQNYDAYQSRRLFRDPDDAVLGGVCSGLGYYFGLDPVWLRLAFVIALFFAGSGPLLYIILWIVLPKANSTAEKLQMRGEQVNIENIERRIKEEAARFRERAEAFGEEARQGFKNANVHGRLGSFMEEFSAVFLGFFRRIILFMGRSFGVFL
ncbi:MAG TPA: PspC domain-containing protein, partial [Flavobacteriales bacterium]|nr:PspC domain-containing protein [Flavobacteriales bacterium]